MSGRDLLYKMVHMQHSPQLAQKLAADIHTADLRGVQKDTANKNNENKKSSSILSVTNWDVMTDEWWHNLNELVNCMEIKKQVLQ